MTITMLAVTYPKYLFENTNSRQFDAYVDCYLEILLAVWEDIKYRVVSKGQAAAIYICQPFIDSVSGVVQQQVARLFDVLNKNSWVSPLVVDSGGSSVVCVSPALMQPHRTDKAKEYPEHVRMVRRRADVSLRELGGPGPAEWCVAPIAASPLAVSSR